MKLFWASKCIVAVIHCNFVVIYLLQFQVRSWYRTTMLELYRLKRKLNRVVVGGEEVAQYQDVTWDALQVVDSWKDVRTQSTGWQQSDTSSCSWKWFLGEYTCLTLHCNVFIFVIVHPRRFYLQDKRWGEQQIKVTCFFLWQQANSLLNAELGNKPLFSNDTMWHGLIAKLSVLH